MNIACSVDVAVEHQPTVWALVCSFVKTLLHGFTALAALLACSSWVDFDQRSSCPLALIFELVQEHAPGGIFEVSSPPTTSRTSPAESFHLLRAEVFDCDHVVGFDQALRDAVQEVLSCSGQPLVGPCEQIHCFSPSVGPFLSSRDFSVKALEFTFGLCQESLCGNRFSVACRDYRDHSQVYADGAVCFDRGVGFRALKDQRGIITICESFDGESFRLTREFAVGLPLDMTNLWDPYHLFRDRIVCGSCRNRKGEAAPSIFESRVPGCFSCFDPAEKSTESQVQTNKRFFCCFGTHELFQVRSQCPEVFDLCLLLVSGDRDPSNFPGLLPLFERGVVQLAVEVQRPLYSTDLVLGRVEAKGQGFDNHVSHYNTKRRIFQISRGRVARGALGQAPSSPRPPLRKGQPHARF
jgi:hypothetical protein